MRIIRQSEDKFHDDDLSFEKTMTYWISPSGHRAKEYFMKDGSIRLKVFSRMCRPTNFNTKIYKKIEELVLLRKASEK